MSLPAVLLGVALGLVAGIAIAWGRVFWSRDARAFRAIRRLHRHNMLTQSEYRHPSNRKD